jgi:hypothetical protein
MSRSLLLPGLPTVCILLMQLTVLSQVPSTGKTIIDFVPAGYDTIATATGDLNKDSVSDYVLVLKSKVEDNFDYSTGNADSIPPRLLIVLFKTANGYQLAGKTDKLIMCKDCGGVMGDPFAGVTIVKGVLAVEHYGGSAWRWSYTHKFRYQQKDFYLIGETNHSYWSVKNCEKLNDMAGTDYKDINFLTGSYEEKVITENCVLKKNKKGKQKVQPLKKLSAFTIDN